MPQRRATSSGSDSLNSQPSPVHEMKLWHDLSVSSSSKNCHNWMGPEPVKQGPLPGGPPLKETRIKIKDVPFPLLISWWSMQFYLDKRPTWMLEWLAWIPVNPWLDCGCWSGECAVRPERDRWRYHVEDPCYGCSYTPQDGAVSHKKREREKENHWINACQEKKNLRLSTTKCIFCCPTASPCHHVVNHHQRR